jgi:hypothetical protein
MFCMVCLPMHILYACPSDSSASCLTISTLQGTGRERYVFFSFPHIGIDETGEVGAISRPGRAKKSCACGALAKCLNEVKADGLGRNFAIPGGRHCCCCTAGCFAVLLPRFS